MTLIRLGFFALMLCGLLPRADAQTPEVVTLTPNRDTSLFEEGPLSNGGGDYLFSGVIANGARRRALLSFPLESIPPGSVVTDVELSLNVSRSRTPFTAPTVSVHRMQVDWQPGVVDAPGQEGIGAAAQDGDATWASRVHPTESWTTPGGDFEATESASNVVIDLGPYQWSSAGLVTDVQGWVDDPSQNFGWILLASESGASGDAKRFDSAEIADPSRRPQLLVSFIPPPPPLPPRAVPMDWRAWVVLILGLIAVAQVNRARVQR